jgi:hypothetical protein
VPFEMQGIVPQPTLQFTTTDTGGRSVRLTICSGLVSVAPPPQRVTVRTAAQPAGEPLSIWVPGVDLLPLEGAALTSEMSLAQVAVAGRTDFDIAYGVGQVTAQLVADTTDPTQGRAYLSFTCFGGMPLALSYRVTICTSP